MYMKIYNRTLRGELVFVVSNRTPRGEHTSDGNRTLRGELTLMDIHMETYHSVSGLVSYN